MSSRGRMIIVETEINQSPSYEGVLCATYTTRWNYDISF
jgi:hypothetical protein